MYRLHVKLYRCTCICNESWQYCLKTRGILHVGRDSDVPNLVSDETDTPMPDSSVTSLGAGDVQKKAVPALPWVGLMPEEELEQDFVNEYADQRSRSNNSQLVVCASLIDKTPNLGG